MGKKSKQNRLRDNRSVNASQLQNHAVNTSDLSNRKGVIEQVLSAETHKWQMGDLLWIRTDYRDFRFVEKTDKGIWCRPALGGSPSNMLLVAFRDILFTKPNF